LSVVSVGPDVVELVDADIVADVPDKLNDAPLDPTRLVPETDSEAPSAFEYCTSTLCRLVPPPDALTSVRAAPCPPMCRPYDAMFEKRTGFPPAENMSPPRLVTGVMSPNACSSSSAETSTNEIERTHE
jgi:hypothetical protein